MYKLVEDELAKSEGDGNNFADSTGMREMRAHLYRLQRLIITLLPKFYPQQLPMYSNNQMSDVEQQHYSSVQIAANILLYARNQVKSR